MERIYMFQIRLIIEFERLSNKMACRDIDSNEELILSLYSTSLNSKYISNLLEQMTYESIKCHDSNSCCNWSSRVLVILATVSFYL